MAQPLPLATKLSFAVTALTIECDNEYERQLLAPTGMDFATWRASKPPTYLVSLPMWANYLRHLDQPRTVGDLAALAGHDHFAISRNLNGLRRWRYVAVEAAGAKNHRQRYHPDDVVQLTAPGRECAARWQPLPAWAEARWQQRLGSGTTAQLRQAAIAMLAELEQGLPWCMPILSSRRELFSRLTPERRIPATPGEQLPLLALLSQTLLAFTLAFEENSPFPLPVVANALRVLDRDGSPLRDLPERTGISAAAFAQCLTLLQRHGLAELIAAPAGQRGRRVRLTAEGKAAQRRGQQRIASIERQWQQRLDAEVDALHAALDTAIGTGDPAQPPLADALAAAPGQWRAELPVPSGLPHHPIPVDRGGWPDGA